MYNKNTNSKKNLLNVKTELARDPCIHNWKKFIPVQHAAKSRLDLTKKQSKLCDIDTNFGEQT